MNWSAGVAFCSNGGFTQADIRSLWGQGDREGVGSAEHMHSLPDSVYAGRGKWSEHAMLSGISQRSSAGGLGLLHQWQILAEKEIHNFVKVVDHTLPMFPPPFLVLTPPHTNSSNRYRLSAYFSHSSISNACVKGALIYVYQLCGALLLGNVIVLMVFLLYSKVANEAYCKKVIDFHWVKM